MNQGDTIDLSKLQSNNAFHQSQLPLNPKLEKLQYDRNNIIYVRDLGQGAFGRVFQVRTSKLFGGFIKDISPNIRSKEEYRWNFH